MNNELILYQTEDGNSQVQLRAADGSVWITQAEIAELFSTSPQAITQLIKTIYEEKELDPSSTCKNFLQVRKEGKRDVKRNLKSYCLPMILAVGYRVRSVRGTQFRQWATTHLSEYLVKGFVMDDERLKNPGGWDYFDELLARIREIRASEKRFYQPVGGHLSRTSRTAYQRTQGTHPQLLEAECRPSVGIQRTPCAGTRRQNQRRRDETNCP
jgi:hypothetical protein